MFPSPIELAEHLATLNVQDDTYPGTVSALLTFNDAAFAHYQLVLGGPLGLFHLLSVKVSSILLLD